MSLYVVTNLDCEQTLISTLRYAYTVIRYSFTHWGLVMHIGVCQLNIFGSDNGLSTVRRQAIIWTKAAILLI